MAAFAVTAVTVASSAEEFPVATRTRDTASVNPMSQVNGSLTNIGENFFFFKVVIAEILVFVFYVDHIFDGRLPML